MVLYLQLDGMGKSIEMRSGDRYSDARFLVCATSSGVKSSGADGGKEVVPITTAITVCLA